MKNIQDIIPDRQIIRLKSKEFADMKYKTWRVKPPIFSDQVESLLENNYMVFIDVKHILIHELITPSPKQIQDNKRFWRVLNLRILEDNK